MRTLSLLIGLSLALAGGALAQQVEEQASPGGKKGKTEETATHEKPIHEKVHGAKTETTTANPEATTGRQHGAKTEVNAANPEATTGAGKQHGVKGEHGAKTLNAAETSPSAGAGTATGEEQIGGKKGHHGHGAEAKTTAETGATGATASPGTSPGGERGEKGRHGHEKPVNAQTSPAPSPGTGAAGTANTTAITNANVATGATATGANANVAVGQGTVGKGGKKIETQQLQQIKQQHASFKAQPRPDKAPPVQFSANFRIEGADRWQGPQYEVFREYHPERHDRSWYHTHYTRVELIGGGYYYWNNGYWVPAWGYDPSAEYYAYNGPIYVGHRAEPPDRVIADVQAELQELGYYQGEVDGLLGPLTRQALADYQAEHGLAQTSAIDEPTLDTLGMG